MLRLVQASNLIQRFTYPLLKLDEKGLPDAFASCVFIGVNGAVYLVTAAHALRSNSVGLLTRGNGVLVQIAGRGTASRADGIDHFDIGAVRMADDAIQENDIQVVPPTMFTSAVEVSNPHARVICGFPASMNKQIRSLERRTKKFTGKCYSYFGFAEYQGHYSAFGKSSDAHIGLDYLPGKDDAGRLLSSPPSPKGISGGGAWLVPDLRQPELVFLEGVFIECHPRRNPRYAFSTRLEHVIDFIAQTHNKALQTDASKCHAPCIRKGRTILLYR